MTPAEVRTLERISASSDEAPFIRPATPSGDLAPAGSIARLKASLVIRHEPFVTAPSPDIDKDQPHQYLFGATSAGQIMRGTVRPFLIRALAALAAGIGVILLCLALGQPALALVAGLLAAADCVWLIVSWSANALDLAAIHRAAIEGHYCLICGMSLADFRHSSPAIVAQEDQELRQREPIAWLRKSLAEEVRRFERHPTDYGIGLDLARAADAKLDKLGAEPGGRKLLVPAETINLWSLIPVVAEGVQLQRANVKGTTLVWSMPDDPDPFVLLLRPHRSAHPGGLVVRPGQQLAEILRLLHPESK